MPKPNDTQKATLALAAELGAGGAEFCALEIAARLHICPGEVYRQLSAGPFERVRELYWRLNA